MPCYTLKQQAEFINFFTSARHLGKQKVLFYDKTGKSYKPFIRFPVAQASAVRCTPTLSSCRSTKSGRSARTRQRPPAKGKTGLCQAAPSTAWTPSRGLEKHVSTPWLARRETSCISQNPQRGLRCANWRGINRRSRAKAKWAGTRPSRLPPKRGGARLFERPRQSRRDGEQASRGPRPRAKARR